MRSASCPGANGLCQRMLEVWPDDRPASRVCRDTSAVRAEVCGRTHGPRAKPTALRVLRAPRHAPGRRAPFASPRLGTVHRSGGVISDSVSGRLSCVRVKVSAHRYRLPLVRRSRVSVTVCSVYCMCSRLQTSVRRRDSLETRHERCALQRTSVTVHNCTAYSLL